MVGNKKNNVISCFKNKWNKYSSWRKTFTILFLLFALTWLSLVSIIVLPAITTIYFLTGIIKNVMDIQTGSREGSLAENSSTAEVEAIGEIAGSDEDFVKFPSKDPRYVRRIKK